MKKIIWIILLLQQVCFAQGENWETDAAPLHRAQKALTDVIIHDIFSPPVASRIYVYTNIAAYEVLVKADKNYHSLTGQINSFPVIPAATKKVNLSLAAVNAFLITGKNLVFSEAIMQDSINHILEWYQQKGMKPELFKSSLAYGKQVADIVLQWVAKDKYKETRSLRRYSYLKEEGKWIPTPPAYMAAIEPYWSKIRPLAMDSCNQFQPELALPFSKEKSSSFYLEAKEVYDTTINLSAANRAIASFWDCNPFAVSTDGHLMYAVKKISPGGHWISIAGLVCRNSNEGILKTSAAYTLTSIALFDGFISCWDEKYRSNVIRPETYINKYMDESWRPLLQTPPFPEYTSGHSVISTAAAAVLASLFGDNTAFDDDTEVEFGLPVKHFSSFTEACNQAAISRLYGGIHYRAAIVNGQTEGRKLGQWVARKVRLM
ncbi:hypothetical protein BH11BAC3_BH11BAC3_13040 [soil metagenome]